MGAKVIIKKEVGQCDNCAPLQPIALSDSESTLPSLPYVEGNVFDLYRAPVPKVHFNEKVNLSRGDPLEYLLVHPSTRLSTCRELYNPSIPERSPLSIRIGTTLKTGREYGHISQVFQASISADCFKTPLVAKFYDPLYYWDEELLCNPFKLAARSVSNEATAYDRLRKLRGKYVPDFYGTYVAPVPGQDRNVYVILLQYVRGTSMDKLDPSLLSMRERLWIMRGVKDAETRLYELGVFTLDFAPRNVIVHEDLLRSLAEERFFKLATKPHDTEAAHSMDLNSNNISDVGLKTGIRLLDFEELTLTDPQSTYHKELRKTILQYAQEEGRHKFQPFVRAGWPLPDLTSWREELQ